MMAPRACAIRIGRHHGFTLVELLVVLAIAAVAISAVPPLFSAALPGVELKAAARRVVTGLRLAREQAIRQGRPLTLIVDVEERRLEIPGHRSVILPRRLEVMFEGAEREMLDADRGGIRFFPDGASTGGRIIIVSGESGYQVGVNWLTGRVRMASWEP